MTKVTTACTPCAARKIKCNGAQPCLACMKAGFKCEYSVQNKRGPKGPRARTRARIDGLKTETETRLQGELPPKNIECGRMDRPQTHVGGGRSNSDLSPTMTRVSNGRIPRNTGNPGALEITGTSSGMLHSLPAFRELLSPRRRSTTSGTIGTRSGKENGNVPPVLLPSIPAIDLHTISAFLDIYEHKLYPVWPVVDVRALKQSLEHDPEDSEAWTLAFALCAAITARLKINKPIEAFGDVHEAVYEAKEVKITSSKLFAEQAESHRVLYKHRAKSSIAAILIPFFLHVYYDCNGNIFIDSFLLREAITVAQLMGIDKEASYSLNKPKQDHHMRRKIFWLLFISERGCSMMRDFPISFSPSLNLPDVALETNPNLIVAFISLVKLFVAVSDIFNNSLPNPAARERISCCNCNSSDGDRKYTSTFFAQLQAELARPPQFSPRSPQIQKADIYLTQQYLQIMVWRFSVGYVNMDASDSEEALSLGFPTRIGREAVKIIEGLPLDVLVAHGRGMEQKVFEIATTLLDVTNVVPSTSLTSSLNPILPPPQAQFHDNHGPTPRVLSAYSTASTTNTGTSPLDILTASQQRKEGRLILNSLGRVLNTLSGGNGPYVELLQRKIDESNIR